MSETKQQQVKLHQAHTKFEQQPSTTDYRASVVVPWLNNGYLLELWKNNVKHLTDAEVIFIDNGSEIETKVALENFCHQHNIKLIRNEENLGFSAANNQGIEVATGEYILHLNNDVEVLSPPIEYLCNLAGDSFSGLVLKQAETGEAYIEGWALCVKKSTLQALKGWCEDYGPGYWDDVDLCHRATAAGYSLKAAPTVNQWVRHLESESSKDGRIDKFAISKRNREIFLKKYYAGLPQAADSEVSSTRLRQLQAELELFQARFRVAQADLEQCRQRFLIAHTKIAAMESSKFWKMRKVWFSIKRFFKLSNEEI